MMFGHEQYIKLCKISKVAQRTEALLVFTAPPASSCAATAISAALGATV